jgi:hypothetical protein
LHPISKVRVAEFLGRKSVVHHGGRQKTVVIRRLESEILLIGKEVRSNSNRRLADLKCKASKAKGLAQWNSARQAGFPFWNWPSNRSVTLHVLSLQRVDDPHS